MFFLWAHIGNLKYGLPLLKEKENQSLVVEGKIEDIHKLKYAIRNSCLITISGAIKQNK